MACAEREPTYSVLENTPSFLVQLSGCNTGPREGISPGPHQTRMCQSVMPRILIPLPSSFWNPKLWSTPALPMPAWNLVPLMVPVCVSASLKRLFAPVTCRHLHTYGLDTSCTISTVLGVHPSFLPSGLVPDSYGH